MPCRGIRIRACQWNKSIDERSDDGWVDLFPLGLIGLRGTEESGYDDEQAFVYGCQSLEVAQQLWKEGGEDVVRR